MNKKVLIPIADGSEEIEAACLIDVLRRAGADLTIASVNNLEITASRQLKILADKLISECKDEIYDLIALPGGMPGAQNLCDNKILEELLKEQKNSGRLFAAICASPAVVFDHQKLIEGYKATCYPSFLEKMRNCIPIDQKIVVDRNCITSQGPATALKFSIKLIEHLFSAQKAVAVADSMLITKYNHK
ncbi:MAG: DJ-1/PfpI family protein [Phycisphaerae bacterium]|nr:DJ-1/PfpI family protein [Phycisphaerae bacterium]